MGPPISAETLSKLDATGWELYHVEEDFAENHNVAAENRDRLIAMIGTWYVEAGKYDVMPIDGSGLARMIVEKPLLAAPATATSTAPTRSHSRTSRPPKSSTVRTASLPTSRSPSHGAEGVLLCQGSAAGGYTLFIQDGKLHYVHNYVCRQYFRVASNDPVPPGSHSLRFEFEPTGEMDLATGKGAPGRLQLYIDGTLVGETVAPFTTPRCTTPAPSPAAEPRIADHPRLRGTVPVHRNDPPGDRRRQRRPHRRRRDPDEGRHRAPVGARRFML